MFTIRELAIWARQVDSPRKILPGLFALLTGEMRYLPEIEWSSKSWVHNAFRCYELLFWRRYGIRVEATYAPYFFIAHSWEAFFAYIETCIRAVRMPKIERVYLPQLAFTGMPLLNVNFPYRLAVALDAANSGTQSGTSPVTYSHTVTGANPLIAIGVSYNSANNTNPTLGTLSYAGAAATQAQNNGNTAGFAKGAAIYLKGTAATGSNTVSAAFSGGAFVPSLGVGSVSYSGAQSGSTKDASAGNSSGSATGSQTVSVSVVSTGCWIVCVLGQYATQAPTAQQTSRYSVAGTSTLYYSLEDTNGTVSAGANSVGWTIDSGNNIGWGMAAASFAPAPAAAIANKIYSVRQAVNRASTY